MRRVREALRRASSPERGAGCTRMGEGVAVPKAERVPRARSRCAVRPVLCTFPLRRDVRTESSARRRSWADLRRVARVVEIPSVERRAASAPMLDDAAATHRRARHQGKTTRGEAVPGRRAGAHGVVVAALGVRRAVLRRTPAEHEGERQERQSETHGRSLSREGLRVRQATVTVASGRASRARPLRSDRYRMCAPSGRGCRASHPHPARSSRAPHD